MSSGTTELTWEGEIPLEQVLEHCQPAHAEAWPDETRTWQHVADALQSNVIENAIIDTLINESMETGLFEEPVVIDVYEPCPGGEECDDLEGHEEYCVKVGEPTRYSLGNGTHRVVAAMTAGYKTIRAATSYDYKQFDGKYLIAAFKASTGPKAKSCDPHFEDAPDECFGFCVLRSFRLTPDVWVDTALASRIHGGIYRVYYEIPHDLAETLEREIRRLAEKHDIILDEFEVIPETEDES